MKRNLTLIILCAINVWGFAQTIMVYEYDSGGNVVSRTLVTPVKSQSKMGLSDMSEGDGANKNVTISKNADSNVFTVNVVGNGESDVCVRIYDINSRLVNTEAFTGSSYAVDLNMYPDGIYILEVKFDDKEYTQKIVKG